MLFERRQGGRERSNISERNTLMDCLPHMPDEGPRDRLVNQIHALDWEPNPRHFSGKAGALTAEQPARANNGYF